MNCREVAELADSFLSEQLLVETNHEIVRHLETCAPCRADIAARRALRHKLQSAFSSAADLAPRPDFAAELASRLQAATAVGDSKLSRRAVLKSWWALAAGLVLSAGGGLWLRGTSPRSRLAALAREATGDHQNCAVKFNLAEKPITLADAARLYGGPYTALATFELPAAADQTIALLERHACVYQGRRFGHVVFRYGSDVASLLVTPAAPPSAIELQTNDGKYKVASFPAGSYIAFVVTELDREKTLRLAQALAAPLSTHFV